LHKLQFSTALGRAFVAALFVPTLAACSDEVKWKEEVRLNDGRVVVIDQARRCAGGNYTAATNATCVATDASLGFRLPETGGQEVTWHERLNPMVLNVSGGHVYLVGYPVHPAEFRAYGGTNPPYIGFVLEGSQWQRIPFERIPAEIYDGNLLIESIPKTRTKSLSLAAKNGPGENGDPRYPAYLRRIDPKFTKPLL
jgi:hypothetical protein